MTHCSNIFCIVVGSTALLLGACRSAPTRIHVLASAPAARNDAYRARPLRIDTVHIPPEWDRIEILSPTAAGELTIDDSDHWSAPLTQVVRQALSADLESRLPAGAVIYPHLPKPDGALGVNVDILAFSAASGQCSMSVSWLITPAAGAHTATRTSMALHSRLTGPGAAAVAAAWSDLVAQLADHIAADAAAFGQPE